MLLLNKINFLNSVVNHSISSESIRIKELKNQFI